MNILQSITFIIILYQFTRLHGIPNNIIMSMFQNVRDNLILKYQLEI